MILSLLLFTTLAAEIHINPGDDFESAVANAVAGDEIIFHEGTYQTTGFWSVDLQGSVDQPIVVRSAEGEAVSIAGIPSQNTIDIQGSHYSFSGFEIIGGSHGVRVGTSLDATFEDLEIHDTGDVGLSCNRPDNSYEDITIRRTHIHHTAGTGECMYLGCNEGACVMFSSLIEFNWCHDTTNSSQGDGIELKTGSYDVVIRHNVIHDVKYPGITMYGTQGGAPNLVEGNLIWNAADNGIQTVGDVTVRNNLVFNAGNNGIQVKPSQGEVPSNVTIVHNTVVIDGGTCLRANDWPADNGNLIAGNALFCAGGTAVRLANAGGGTWMNNGVIGALEGLAEGTFELGEATSELVDPGAWHGYPTPDSSLIGAASEDWADEDFNCLAREGQDVGAYAYGGALDPGWIPEPGFKSCADPGGDTGGDGSGEDGSSEDGSGGSSGEDGPGDGSADEVGGATGGEELSGADGGSGGCALGEPRPSTPLGLMIGMSILVGLRRRS